jgi:hypothetical protein
VEERSQKDREHPRPHNHGNGHQRVPGSPQLARDAPTSRKSKRHGYRPSKDPGGLQCDPYVHAFDWDRFGELDK